METNIARPETPNVTTTTNDNKDEEQSVVTQVDNRYAADVTEKCVEEISKNERISEEKITNSIKEQSKTDQTVTDNQIEVGDCVSQNKNIVKTDHDHWEDFRDTVYNHQYSGQNLNKFLLNRVLPVYF